jgi:hypothetical protein
VSFLKSLVRFLGPDLWAELRRSSSVVRQDRAGLAPINAEALASIEEILHLRLREWYRSAMLSYQKTLDQNRYGSCVNSLDRNIPAARNPIS